MMHSVWITVGVALFCVAINLPFGRWRSRQRRFSVTWFALIHAPVPLIIILRLWLHADVVFIPLFIGCSVLGQYLGGKINAENNNII
jgi:ABC-type spermidine/putrescine transport system permease subunit I